MGIDPALVTCVQDNIGSRKLIEACHPRGHPQRPAAVPGVHGRLR
jgi:hypothetical protein